VVGNEAGASSGTAYKLSVYEKLELILIDKHIGDEKSECLRDQGF